MNFAIVVPCYNESERLETAIFEDFLKTHPQLTFCFVNDGSTDQTLEVLKKMEHQYPEQVNLIDQEKNLGKANAVRLGMRSILKEKNCDRIAFLDADLSTPLEECYALAKKSTNTLNLYLHPV